MKHKILISTRVKYTVAVCALLAAPSIFAQQKNDTISKAKDIEEVVMIGYGTTKKSDLTGSVSTLKGAEITKVPVVNVAEALTGKIAGVKITTTEGSPDAEVGIKIRGGNSVTQDASPLIIVDGFPIASLNDIAPSDIETLTVLKDASSTAIYGSRGANGVILVTTKTGKAGKLSVNFNSYAGFKKKANTLDVLSPLDYVKWQYEFAQLTKNTTITDKYTKYFGNFSDINNFANTRAINWQDEIYGRLGEIYSNDLSVRGGTEKASYNINLARYDEKGIMLSSGLVRDNFSVNLKAKPTDKLDLSVTLRYSNTVVGGGGANEQNEVSSADSRLKNAVLYTPFNVAGLTVQDPDDAEGESLINPFTTVYDNDRKQERRNYNLQGSVGYKILQDLQFRTDVGIDYFRYRDARFYGRSTYYVQNAPPGELQGMPAIAIGTREDKRFRNSNTLNYDLKKLLGDNHSIKLLVGQELLINKRTTLTNVIQGFPNDFFFDDAANLTTVGTPFSIDNNTEPDDTLLSFFGRVNYDFMNKYLFTATMRADGSSKFLGKDKWGYFPSAAVAWKINEENFLKDINWINTLKLRASYGIAGNNNIPTGQQVQLFSSTTNAWINNVDSYLSSSKILFNNALKWESTTTQNLGLDYDFYRGRISGSLEIYKNVTKDLLFNFPLPGSGYDSQYQNFGEVQNKGIEGAIDLGIVRKEDFNVNFGFNISFNKGKLNDLGQLVNYRESSRWASTAIDAEFPINVGQPIGQIFGYLNDGRYEVSDFNFVNGAYVIKAGVADGSVVTGAIMPGTMKLKDINGDGVVNSSDRTIIGDTNPKYTGGFNLATNYKNFDFSAAFNFTVGNDVYNANKIEYTTSTPGSPSGQFRNLLTDQGSGIRWNNIDPGTGALVTDPGALAALNANTTMWSPFMSRFVLSDYAIEDGSFLRLNNITVGYSFPANLTDKIGLSKVRLYATANNVFIITKYSGLDPEVSTRRRTPLTPGVDYSPFPKARTLVFGVNVSF